MDTRAHRFEKRNRKQTSHLCSTFLLGAVCLMGVSMGLLSSCILRDSKVKSIVGSSQTSGGPSAVQKCLGEIQNTFGLKFGAVESRKDNVACFTVHSTAATRLRLMFFKRSTREREFLSFDLEKGSQGKVTTTGNADSLNVTGHFNPNLNAFTFKVMGPLDVLRSDSGAIIYAYRAWGSNWPHTGDWKPGTLTGRIQDIGPDSQRFNPNKVLLDPYALEVTHDYVHENIWNDLKATQNRVIGEERRIVFEDSEAGSDVYRIGVPLDIYRNGPTTDSIDTVLHAPKAVLQDVGAFQPFTHKRPDRPFWQDIVYQTHVRGLTKAHHIAPTVQRYGSFDVNGISGTVYDGTQLEVSAVQGTYDALRQKAEYLKKLGITTVYLLPVHEYNNAANGQSASIRDNYWGYWNYNYFSADKQLAATRGPGQVIKEFRAMARALHEHGIKLMIDVVYNHTGEHCYGDDEAKSVESVSCESHGPIFSMRGFDNTFYMASPDLRYYYSSSGVGPSLDNMSETGSTLILQSLRYWHEFMGVDGYRFDVGPHLGGRQIRDESNNVVGLNNFDRQNEDTLLWRIAQGEGPKVRHILAGGEGVDMMVEPWGMTQGFQSGNFSPGYSEWNAKGRDTYKETMMKPVEFTPPSRLSEVLLGTFGLYAGDYFNDVDRWLAQKRGPIASINYVTAHDGMNMRDLVTYGSPTDSDSDGDKSWDHGGDLNQSFRSVRNFHALLMVSRGIPQVFGGDEIFHSKRGRHNSYNVDNPDTWLQWDPGSWEKPKQHSGGSVNTEQFGAHVQLLPFLQHLYWLRRNHVAFAHPIWTNYDPKSLVSWYYDDGNSVGPNVGGEFWNNGDEGFLGMRIDNGPYIRSDMPVRSFFVAINWKSEKRKLHLPGLSGGQEQAGTRWCQLFNTGIGANKGGFGFHPQGRAQWFEAGLIEERSLQIFAERVGSEDENGICSGPSLIPLEEPTEVNRELTKVSRESMDAILKSKTYPQPPDFMVRHVQRLYGR